MIYWDIVAIIRCGIVIAGDDKNHIEMSRTGEKKYYDMKPPRSLQLSDLVDHFRGGQARGALCRYQDGSCRALCFDTDDSEEWEAWKLAARKLVQAGYMVLFEESPAGRGRHLWIVFDELVNAAAARAAVLEIAPELAVCEEYWPGPTSATSWNRVRLPGGFYARYGRYVEQPVKAWCKMINVATGESSSDGRSAARLLTSSLTPAAIVPPLPVISVEEVSEIHTQDEQTEACTVALSPFGGEDNVPFTTQNEQMEARNLAQPETVSPAAPLPNTDEKREQGERLPEVDARWIQNYGPVETTICWFAVMPNYAAECYNREHDLEEIRPRERNGMAMSPNGNERTALRQAITMTAIMTTANTDVASTVQKIVVML